MNYNTFMIVFILPLLRNALSDNNEEDSIRDLFENVTVALDDLKPSATEEAIELLRGKDTTKGLNLHLLRKFLMRKGFLQNPGSLEFLHPQQISLNFKCPGGNWWRVKGLGRVYDEDFNKARHHGEHLQIDTPDLELYFQIFLCAQVKGGEEGKRHLFYVITRPMASIKFPQQYKDGEENIEIACEMDPCLYEWEGDCKDKYAFKPVLNPPYTFRWNIKDKTNITAANPPLKYKIIEKHYGKKITALNNDGEEQVFGEDNLISSTVKIDKAEPENGGMYECIITDGNGVESSAEGVPNPSETRYRGKATVHVRATIYWIIPLACTVVMIVIILLINCLCTHRMEYDDGTPYAKEDYGDIENEEKKKDKIVSSDKAEENKGTSNEKEEEPKAASSDEEKSAASIYKIEKTAASNINMEMRVASIEKVARKVASSDKMERKVASNDKVERKVTSSDKEKKGSSDEESRIHNRGVSLPNVPPKETHNVGVIKTVGKNLKKS